MLKLKWSCVFRRVRKIAKSCYSLRHVCLHGTTRLPLHGFSWNRIFMYFFRKAVQKIQDLLKSDKHNGYFTWRPLDIFYHIFHTSFRMRNVSHKSSRRNNNTHFAFNIFFFENRAVNKKMWKNIVKSGRPQMKIWRMRIACRIPKPANNT